MNVAINTVAFVFFLGSSNRSKKYILRLAQIAKPFMLQTTRSEVSDTSFLREFRAKASSLLGDISSPKRLFPFPRMSLASKFSKTTERAMEAISCY